MMPTYLIFILPLLTHLIPSSTASQTISNTSMSGTRGHGGPWRGRSQTLWIQGLVCLRGTWPDGRTVMLATEMALQHIHAQPSMLPGYRLQYSWVDTECDPGTGTFRMINDLMDGPPRVMIMGAAVSPVSESTALLSHHYNLTQISYDSGSSTLSDKKAYPNFFRVYQTASARAAPTVAICHYFGWRKVATLHQALDVFAKYLEYTASQLEANNITVLTSEIFNVDPSMQVANLKAHDARIIVAAFFPNVGVHLFCEAYKLGLYGPSIVWIIGTWYPLKWWEDADDSLPCTQEQLIEVDVSVLRIGQFQINPDQDIMTVSGYTPRELHAIWEQKSGGKPMFFDSSRFIMYDTPWAVALALNGTLTDTLRDDGTSPISTFTYSNGELGKIIKANMAKVKFSGARGSTEFDEYGDCRSPLKIVYDHGRQVVGMYGPDSSGTEVLTWFGQGIQWPDNRVPRDSTLRMTTVDFLSWSVYVGLSSVATFGLILSLGFLTFNILLRNKRLIKMSSPNMNNILLLGCILIYITIFLHEQHEDHVVPFCVARNFTMTVGFSLVFGSLFSKTWRVHVIFTTKNVKGVGIHDVQLIGMVVGLVGINLLVLILWTILDLYTITLLNTTVEIILTKGQDSMIQHQVAVCTSVNGVYFRWTLYIVQAVLLAFGAFLAWETKGVKLEALNDSQLIGSCIYNVVILSTLGVGLGVVLQHEPHLVVTLVDIFLLLGTTITQCVIFLPKILGVVSGQSDVAPSTMKTDGVSTTVTEA